MTDNSAITARFTLIHEAADDQQTLHRALAFALTATACDMASIILRAHDGAEVAAWTHRLARHADELQLNLADGPGVTPVDTHEIFRIDHTNADPRWPCWGSAVAQLGISSALSVQLTTTEHTAVGSINLYALRPAAFDDHDADMAMSLAGHTTAAYLAGHRNATANLGIRDRTTISQAEQILMERFGIAADKATHVLRRYAASMNMPLCDAVARISGIRQLPQQTRERPPPSR